MTNMHCGVRIERIDDILGYTDAFGYLQMFYGGEDRALEESSSDTLSTSRLCHLRLSYCTYARQGTLWPTSRHSQSKS